MTSEKFKVKITCERCNRTSLVLNTKARYKRISNKDLRELWNNLTDKHLFPDYYKASLPCPYCGFLNEWEAGDKTIEEYLECREIT
jgi:hypothetical protein